MPSARCSLEKTLSTTWVRVTMTIVGNPVAIGTVLALFTMTSIGCAVRAVTSAEPHHRVNSVLHLIAGLVMIAMLWTWFLRLPAVYSIAFFAAAACWYAVLLLRDTASPRTDARTGHHESRGALAYHAAMMLAMAWMVVAMTPLDPASTMESDAMGHEGHRVGMAGTDAGGMSTHHGMHAMTGSEAWALPLTWALGVGLALAAGWFGLRLAHQVGRTTHWHPHSVGVAIDTAVDAAMAAGMAVMFLVMMT